MANKIAILGGGASALMCAASFSKDSHITIFEKNTKLGKKILATGNGRCNLANIYMNKCSYNTNIQKYINKFKVDDILNLFKSFGLEYYNDEEGRVYPLSNSASSVLDVLLKKVQQNNNISVLLGVKVVDIKKTNNKYEVFFDNDTSEEFDKVIVAFGNEANLEIFKKLNIKCRDFVPSLCSLKTNTNKNLSGVRVSGVNVSCEIDGENFSQNGEILFKEDAISGIVIFNLSCFLARKNVQKTTFYIDFLPKYTQNELFLKLKERKDELSSYKCKDFLCGMFVGAIADMLLSKIHINFDDYVKNISDEKLHDLVICIKQYKVNMIGYEDNNQVKVGGVILEELDNNLQSIKNNGLYFIGESVNVDGMCGGYNLMWAWISGLVVAEAI